MVRMVILAVSMNCGFVGGFIYPMLTIGTIAGAICSEYYDYLPFGFSFCFVLVVYVY